MARAPPAQIPALRVEYSAPPPAGLPDIGLITPPAKHAAHNSAGEKKTAE
jgi:hypothetical protein